MPSGAVLVMTTTFLFVAASRVVQAQEAQGAAVLRSRSRSRFRYRLMAVDGAGLHDRPRRSGVYTVHRRTGSLARRATYARACRGLRSRGSIRHSGAVITHIRRASLGQLRAKAWGRIAPFWRPTPISRSASLHARRRRTLVARIEGARNGRPSIEGDDRSDCGLGVRYEAS